MSNFSATAFSKEFDLVMSEPYRYAPGAKYLSLIDNQIYVVKATTLSQTDERIKVILAPIDKTPGHVQPKDVEIRPFNLVINFDFSPD